MAFWNRKKKKAERDEPLEIVIELSGLEAAQLRFQACRENLGAHHPDTLEAAHVLGRVASREADRRQDAAELYEWLVAARREVLGEHHPDTLTTLHEAGGLQYMLGDLVSAEQHMVDALAGREHALGRGHADTLASARGLGTVLTALGRSAEAQALQRDVEVRLDHQVSTSRPAPAPEPGRRSALGPQGVEALNSRAIEDLQAGRNEEAIAICRMVIVSAAGDDLAEVRMDARVNLATGLLRTGRVTDAEVQLRLNLEERERACGPDHADTIKAAENLAKVMAMLGKNSESRSLVQRCLRFYEGRYPAGHAGTNHLRELLRELG